MSCRTEFESLKKKFIDAVIENINQRVPETDFLRYMSVLARRPISFLDDTELALWGNEEVQKLVIFYGSDQCHLYKDPDTNEMVTVTSEAIVNTDATMTEWMTLKRVVKAQQYPRSSMASLWNLICQYHSEEFPNMQKLAGLALCHPIHTADCERSFSSQNLITMKLRCRQESIWMS
ncbi:uncharacterized protein LOC128169340 [Crassostrea angulata]|uniref:uncharacterized protein LOC128169340 n=1 Tax=Magallana angulata TaxID=2784310 RepID=UPI0022B1EAF3|nr:uncharacterized protein LOC128169340 [Crassostrea angulata]